MGETGTKMADAIVPVPAPSAGASERPYSHLEKKERLSTSGTSPKNWVMLRSVCNRRGRGEAQHHLWALINKFASTQIEALRKTRLDGDWLQSNVERRRKRGQSSPHLTHLPKHSSDLVRVQVYYGRGWQRVGEAKGPPSGSLILIGTRVRHPAKQTVRTQWDSSPPAACTCTHACSHPHTRTCTGGTEPSTGSVHSDLMKLMESLSWSEMRWEEGHGLLSLRTVQRLSGMPAPV
ncbi:uncharacterized protein LOC128626510 [Artibeus jamaicensis]|uniref:uncharacterized protein LOC128626510 n=1 Tax=Artibeus jamaicensis TaxID=9417 RepID=UPI00235AD7B7|nr:uncharacterized protein LOC128626510 [Artibeus jamaicensis]